MRCYRVSAQEFMRPHGVAAMDWDQFIGVSKPYRPGRGAELAFKMVPYVSIISGGYPKCVIWCPVSELPADYLKNAHKKPNRVTPGEKKRGPAGKHLL